MSSLNDVKFVVKKISSIKELGEHICFFGGSIPYIYFNQESHREHSDIDVLIDFEYMDYIRLLLQQNGLYKPELDSLNLNLGDDYGLKVFIDGIYVEFEPMIIEDGFFIRKSFSPTKEVAGVEQIPYEQLEDLITRIDIDGIKTFCQSMEMIKVSKEKYKRDKDLFDINFIDSKGIDFAKYERVKKSIELSSTLTSTYDELREKKLR